MGDRSLPGVNGSGPGPQAVLCKSSPGMQRLATAFQDAQGGGMAQVDPTFTLPCSKASIWISPGEQGALPCDHLPLLTYAHARAMTS